VHGILAHLDQVERDTRARDLVSKILNSPGPGQEEISQSELNQAIEAASQEMRAFAFSGAANMRQAYWKSDKEKMERSIPVFRALIASDTNDGHQNHGQLGFALKDKCQPDWKAAESELTTAIEIRNRLRSESRNGHPDTEDWLIYEFVRAVCRIASDPAYLGHRPTEPSVREPIVSDLLSVAASERTSRYIGEEPITISWLKLNPEAATELGREPSSKASGRNPDQTT
jgi:hypothetical protein